MDLDDVSLDPESRQELAALRGRLVALQFLRESRAADFRAEERALSSEAEEARSCCQDLLEELLAGPGTERQLQVALAEETAASRDAQSYEAELLAQRRSIAALREEALEPEASLPLAAFDTFEAQRLRLQDQQLRSEITAARRQLDALRSGHTARAFHCELLEEEVRVLRSSQEAREEIGALSASFSSLEGGSSLASAAWRQAKLALAGCEEQRLLRGLARAARETRDVAGTLSLSSLSLDSSPSRCLVGSPEVRARGHEEATWDLSFSSSLFTTGVGFERCEPVASAPHAPHAPHAAEAAPRQASGVAEGFAPEPLDEDRNSGVAGGSISLERRSWGDLEAEAVAAAEAPALEALPLPTPAFEDGHRVRLAPDTQWASLAEEMRRLERELTLTRQEARSDANRAVCDAAAQCDAVVAECIRQDAEVQCMASAVPRPSCDAWAQCGDVAKPHSRDAAAQCDMEAALVSETSGGAEAAAVAEAAKVERRRAAAHQLRLERQWAEEAAAAAAAAADAEGRWRQEAAQLRAQRQWAEEAAASSERAEQGLLEAQQELRLERRRVEEEELRLERRVEEVEETAERASRAEVEKAEAAFARRVELRQASELRAEQLEKRRSEEELSKAQSALLASERLVRSMERRLAREAAAASAAEGEAAASAAAELSAAEAAAAVQEETRLLGLERAQEAKAALQAREEAQRYRQDFLAASSELLLVRGQLSQLQRELLAARAARVPSRTESLPAPHFRAQEPITEPVAKPVTAEPVTALPPAAPEDPPRERALPLAERALRLRAAELKRSLARSDRFGELRLEIAQAAEDRRRCFRSVSSSSSSPSEVSVSLRPRKELKRESGCSGVSCLARCIFIARRGQVAGSSKNRLMGVLAGGAYFVVLAGCSAWLHYAKVLEEVMCAELDTEFAARLRHLGRPLAPSETWGP
ncbi:unnamed protein product [Effrenium voratum]|nr:unnamed protein product [Effrenium voratum]